MAYNSSNTGAEVDAAVSLAETSLQPPTVSTKTASYTLVAGDAFDVIEMDVASANNVTVNSGVFVAGQSVVIVQKGAGTTTVVAGASVTIDTEDTLSLNAQYSAAALLCTGTDEFILFGSLATA